MKKKINKEDLEMNPGLGEFVTEGEEAELSEVETPEIEIKEEEIEDYIKVENPYQRECLCGNIVDLIDGVTTCSCGRKHSL
jgi:hypothetical protein